MWREGVLGHRFRDVPLASVLARNSHIASFARQLRYCGILVPVRTSFGLRRRGGKTYNVST